MTPDDDQMPVNSPQEDKVASANIPDTPYSSKPKSKRTKRSLLTLVIICLLLSAVLLNYLFNKTTRTLLIHTQDTQSQQANDLTHLQDTLKHTIQADQQLAAKMEQFEHRMQSILKEQHYQTSDWQLQKARYYLELAQINSYWTNDSQTAIALLNQADHVLADIHTLDLHTVRKALAQDVMTLQKKPQINSSTLLTKLQKIQDQVALLNQAFPNNAAPATSPVSAPPTTWRDKLLSNLKQLQSLVVVHHYQGDSVMAHLTPNYVIMIKENVRLNLQEARIAVLNHQTSLYESALDMTIHTIEQYFDNQDPQTTEILKKLKSLRALPIASTKPETLTAIGYLDTVIQSSQPLTNAPSTESAL